MDEKVMAVLQQEGFIDKFLEIEDPEEVQKLFAENGIELTKDEVMAIGKGLAQEFAEEGEELDEDDLDDVAGGSASAIVGAVVSGVCYVVKNARRIDRAVRRFFRRLARW